MADSAPNPYCSSDSLAQKSGLFRVSGLFVRSSTKALLDPDSARSPTSPLDSKAFSNLGAITAKSPASPGHGSKLKSWDSSKIGLGLVNTLSDESLPCGTRKVLLATDADFSSDTSKIGPFPQLGHQHIKLESGKNAKSSMNIDGYSSNLVRISDEFGMSEIDCFSSDTNKIGPFPHLGHQHIKLESGKTAKSSMNIGGYSSSLVQISDEFGCLGSLSMSEIACFSSDTNKIGPFPQLGHQHVKLESAKTVKSSMNIHGYLSSLCLSEIAKSADYTRIISRGPNLKSTHILEDCILGTQTGGTLEPLPFLSSCCYCNEKLKEGDDIYIYLGEKAFCSSECRESFMREEVAEEEPATVSVGAWPGSFSGKLRAGDG